jgi:hypothetical protein
VKFVYRKLVRASDLVLTDESKILPDCVGKDFESSSSQSETVRDGMSVYAVYNATVSAPTLGLVRKMGHFGFNGRPAKASLVQFTRYYCRAK